MNKLQYCSKFIIFFEVVKMYILAKLKIRNDFMSFNKSQIEKLKKVDTDS